MTVMRLIVVMMHIVYKHSFMQGNNLVMNDYISAVSDFMLMMSDFMLIVSDYMLMMIHRNHIVYYES